jgi:hypothetical protein
MEETVAFVSMDCRHELCDACLQKVMASSKECPMCRLKLSKQTANEINHVIEIHEVIQEVECSKPAILCLLFLTVSFIMYGMSLLRSPT